MADALMGVTEAQRMDLITSLVQKELIAQAVLAPTVRNVSQYAQKGLKSITFPYAGHFTVNDKSENTAVDAQILTYSGDQLNLDKHKVVQWIIEKIASTQSVVDMELDTISRAVAALAKQLDTDIFTALSAASASAPDHRVAFAGATIALADIVDANALLDEQEVPQENRYLAINPTQKKAMLKIDGFIDASKWGNSMPIQKGVIGEVYGNKVVMTTVITSTLSLVYHSDAVVWGLQLAPEYDSQKDLANLGTRHSVDQLYGVKTMQGGKLSVKLGSAS